MAIILSVSSCYKRSMPSGPYDATPTPAQPLHVEISLSDSGVAAVGVTITADSSSGTTNSQGYLVLMVQGFGVHHLIISPDISHGFTNAVTFTVDVTKDWTQAIIDRGALSLGMTLDPKSANIFTCINNTIVYHLTYNTSIQRQLNLSVLGLPNSFIWQFDPPYVLNNGDTSTLTITTPKYYQQGYYYAPLTFTAWGMVGTTKYPVGDTVNGYVLYQGWNFKLKNQNSQNQMPIKYLNVGLQSLPGGTQYISTLNVSLNSNGTNNSDTIVVDHTNFPTCFPVGVSVLADTIQVYDGAWKSFYSYATHIPNANYGSPMDIVNGTNIGFLDRELDINLAPITGSQFQILFYNSDGFSMTVTATTNFTY